MITGIVLAGGVSRRLGRDKAVEPLAGAPLIRRVINRLSQVAEQIVVVVDDEGRSSEMALPASVRVVVDIYANCGSLGGIFTGLSAADGDWGIVVACDMPFLNLDLLRHMLTIRDGYDVVIPVLGNHPEPTHAAYSKVCLPHIEKRLQASDLKIVRFFDEVRVKYVPQNEIDKIDPEHLSFFNVNTQCDLDRALSLAAEGC